MSVCQSVRLSLWNCVQNISINYRQILMKFWRGPRDESIRFSGDHLDHDLDLGILKDRIANCII